MNVLRAAGQVASCVVAIIILSIASAHAANEVATGPSGLPVPRFVSLKADKVNTHVGPAKTYDVTWVYTRAGLPVEITAEFENWRRVRDAEGAEGWVYHSLLSGRRTGVVMAKGKDELIPLRDQPEAEASLAAQLQAGVLGAVKKCTGSWCRISGEKFDGWIEQERLWGVYPNEKID
jgi:SH3-like domain-containing protein